MSAYEFPCPVCSLTLRARNQSVVGQVIECADCQTPLLVEQDGDGRLFARRQQDVSPLASKSAKTRPLDASNPVQRNTGTSNSSKLWVGMVGMVLLVIGTLFVMGRPVEESSDENRSVDQSESTQNLKNSASSKEIDEPPANSESDKPERDDLYADLKERIRIFQEGSGEFPHPVTSGPADPTKRFSWIASLEAVTDPTQLQPLWNRAWDDPLNEHFVRRSLTRWLNPAISPKTSVNRFPASHFVGIAGLGKDAARLPSSNPKAGMFGDGRTITVEDLRAGAANVWMLAGVQDQIGAWAANGKATVRPWTSGPVIGGPDGFGTGQNDSMPILMADGRVRTISSQTDVKILERLATIHADDDRVVAQQDPPLLPKPPENNNPQQPAKNRVFEFLPLRAPKPPESELADLLALLKKDLGVKPEEPQPAKNVELQLSQKLLVFDLREPQQLQTVLQELSEMSGVPILISREELGEAGAKLEQRVTLSLIETTLKEVIDRLLRDVGLGYRIESGRIKITNDPLTPPGVRADFP